MSESYDLRSNIKGKPGSQGTLFQVKDKGLLNPQQRWPRGYTPERQAEVRDALSKTDMPNDAFRARVHDTVSRSTIPVADIKPAKSGTPSVTEIHDRPDAGTTGSYWRTRREIGVDMMRPRTEAEGSKPATDPERDLIHEMGHHADLLHGHTDYNLGPQIALGHARKFMPSHADESAPLTATSISMAKSRTFQGVSEAVADNYYQEHYRARGRQGNPVEKGIYEERGNSTKYPGYTDVRPPQTNMSPQQFQPALISRDQVRVSGQKSELQRRLAARTDATRRAVGENL